MNPVLEAIHSRWSIRRYSEQPVPAALLNALLDAARWAPSAHNRQPQRFAVIQGAKATHALAMALGGRLPADLAADGLTAEAMDRDARRSYRCLTAAPVREVLASSMTDMDTDPDARQHREWVMAVQSVVMAAQNMLLAARHDVCRPKLMTSAT